MEKNIGERLREIRKENGDTQEKLAEILNYSVKTIRRYENSKTHPTNEFLSLFGVHYNVSFDYLLRGEEGMDTKTYKPDNTDCVEEAEMYFEKYLEAKKKLMQTDYDSEERLFIIVEKYGDSWFSRYGAIVLIFFIKPSHLSFLRGYSYCSISLGSISSSSTSSQLFLPYASSVSSPVCLFLL